MKGILKNQKTIDGGGWFINNIPLHPDDIEESVQYQDSELVHIYENQCDEYYIDVFNHNFFGELYIVRISL